MPSISNLDKVSSRFCSKKVLENGDEDMKIPLQTREIEVLKSELRGAEEEEVKMIVEFHLKCIHFWPQKQNISLLAFSHAKYRRISALD